MGKYEHTCFGCEHADVRPDSHDNMNGSRREIRCSEYRQYVEPYGEGLRCHSYRDGHYPDDYIQRCVDTFNRWCNYYIVSACMGIVNMPNASAYLDAFKEAKDVDLHSSEVTTVFGKYGVTPELLLEDYDVYGKAVADSMYAAYQNPETREACINHVKTVIIPELNRIMAKKNEGHSVSAIINYIALTRNLMSFYGIEYNKEEAKTEETPVYTEEATGFGSR